MNNTHTTTNYVCNGFDVGRFYDEFFQDESDSVLNHIDHSHVVALGLMDMRGFVLDVDAHDTPVAYKIMRKRADHLKFPLSDAACLFLSSLGSNPGKLVMFCVAYAVAWDTRSQFMLEHEKFKKPDMQWLLEMHNSGFSCGHKDPHGPHWIEADLWGIPGEEHLSKMWDSQKLANGSNGLDHVYLKEELL
jgi:hypothetical protein